MIRSVEGGSSSCPGVAILLNECVGVSMRVSMESRRKPMINKSLRSFLSSEIEKRVPVDRWRGGDKRRFKTSFAGSISHSLIDTDVRVLFSPEL